MAIKFSKSIQSKYTKKEIGNNNEAKRSNKQQTVQQAQKQKIAKQQNPKQLQQPRKQPEATCTLQDTDLIYRIFKSDFKINYIANSPYSNNLTWRLEVNFVRYPRAFFHWNSERIEKMVLAGEEIPQERELVGWLMRTVANKAFIREGQINWEKSFIPVVRTWSKNRTYRFFLEHYASGKATWGSQSGH